MKHARHYILIVLIFVTFLGLYHSNTISNIQQYFFGDFSDGLKNYYTPLYHIAHDKSYSHFEGMNYPFGEQVVFTDNQPAISNSLKLLSHVFPSIITNGIGIFNSLMFLSILLCGIFFFKIFSYFNPNAGYQEAVYSILLALISPQINRMGGHYALAYSFVIPMVWYLGLRHIKNASFANTFLLAFAILFSGGLHIYFLILSCGLLFLTYFFYYIFFLRKRLKLLELLHLFIQIIVPAIILLGWIKLTEIAELRPKSPHGFLDHTSSMEGVFLPIGMPLEFVIKSIVNLRPVPWEGLSYIGMFATLFAIIFLVILLPLKLILRKKSIAVVENHQSILYASLFSALVFLVYSFGFPFNYKMEFLLEYIGPLKQFRGIGRFSWLFFYVFNVFAFVLFTSLVKNKRWLLWVPCLILLYDATHFHKITHYSRNQIPELTNAATRDSHWINQIELEDIQAIMPIPYFHGGSEFLSILPNSESITKETMIASLISGLPMLAVQLSRTDMQQTVKNMKLYLEPLTMPAILEDFPNRKKFLLIIDKNIELPKIAQDIVNHSIIIKETDSLFIAKWDAFSFYKKNIADEKKQIVSVLNNKPSFLSDSTMFFVFKEYSKKENNHQYKLFGSYKDIQINKEWIVLEQITYNKAETVKAKVAIWCFLMKDRLPDTRMIVEGRNNQGQIIFWRDFGIKDHIKTLEEGWALFEGEIELQKDLEYFFLLHNRELKQGFKLYNFLLYENGLDFYRKDSVRVWKNNRFYSNK